MEASLYSSDIQQGIVPSHTTAEVAIYIATTGSDVTGNGTLLNPYASWTKALAQVPQYIDHRVRIKAKAGTYTGFPAHLRHSIGPDGILSLEGMDAPTVVAGPFTLTGFSEVGVGSSKAGADLTVAGAGWAADQFYGKFLRLTSGGTTGYGLGTCHAIYGTEGDVMSLVGFPTWWGIGPGDTFEIVEPSTKIVCAKAPVFSIRGDSMFGRRYAQWVMANLDFEANLTGYGPGYCWNEDVVAVWGLVRFVGLNPSSTIFSQKSGIANLSGIDIRFLPLLEDDALVVVFASGWAVETGSVQITAGSVPPVTAAAWYEVVGGDSVERGVGIYGCVCRNGVYANSCWAEFSNSGFGFLDIDHHSLTTVLYVRVKAAGLGKHAVRIDDGSSVSLEGVWVDSSSKSGIIVEDGSTAECGCIGGNALAIVDYGMLLTRAVRVILDADVSLEGAKGKVRMDRSATTVDYPIAGACVIDSQGTFMVR